MTDRVIEVLHINRADFHSNRMVNEFGSKRPAEAIVVGRITLSPGEKAGGKARATFPAPDGWFVSYRVIESQST